MNSIIDGICSLALVIFSLSAGITLSLSFKESLGETLGKGSPKLNKYTQSLTGSTLDLSYDRIYK